MKFNTNTTQTTSPLLSDQLTGGKFYKFNTSVNDLTGYSEGLSSNREYDVTNHDKTDYLKDAWAKTYLDIQRGEMNEEGIEMTKAQQDKADLEQLLQYKRDYDIIHGYADGQLASVADEIGEDGTSLRQRTDVGYKDALNKLKQRGVITTDGDKVDEEWIRNTIQQKNEDYADHEKKYMHNLDQFNNIAGKFDISQYFTKKANEQVATFGNFFYKMPNTMGYSLTTPMAQLSRMVGAIAGGALTGAATGALVGTPTSPLGQLALSGVGMVGGAVGGFLAGGRQARDYESRMEQFTGMVDRIERDAKANGCDMDKLYTSFKNQLDKKGIDTSNMDNRQILETAVATDGVTSNSAIFNDVVNKAYTASRGIYERNMALGASDFATECLYAFPIGRIPGVSKITSLFKTPGFVKNLANNKIYGMLSKRFNFGVDVARAGSTTRTRMIANALAQFSKRAAVQGIEEGTEEGAQQLIQYEYLNGLYDNEQTNDSAWQDIASGDVFKNIVGNIGRRLTSAAVALGINDQYRGDQEMAESMLMGAFMPFTDPRSAVRNTIDVADTLLKIKNSKAIAQMHANNLSNRDMVSRSTQLLDLLDDRTLGVDIASRIPLVGRLFNNSGRNNYIETIESLRQQMLKHDKDGKIAAAGADLTAITEDGSVPTDKDINDYFDNQIREFDKLWGTRKKLSKPLSKSNVDPKDYNTYIALRHQAATLAEEADRDYTNAVENIKKQRQVVISDTAENSMLNQLKAKAKAQGVDLSRYSNQQLYDIMTDIENLQHVQQTVDQQTALLANTNAAVDAGIISKDTLDATADSLRAAQKELSAVQDRVKKHTDQLALVKVDGVEDITSTNLLDLYTKMPILSEEFSDNEQYNNLRGATMDASQAQMRAINNIAEVGAFDAVTNYAKARLQQYKDSIKKDNEIAQQQTDDAQNGVESQVEPAKQGDDTPKNYTDLTGEQVEAMDKQVTETLNDDINRLNSILDSFQPDENNPVYKYIVEPILKGRHLAQDTPINYARFIAQTMRRSLYSYNQKLTDTTLPQEVKDQFKQLKQYADVLANKATQLTNLAIEQKARAKRRGVKLAADTQIYRDADGNEYNIDTNSAQYSENEGLILNLKKKKEVDPSLEQKVESARETLDIAQKVLDRLYKEHEKAYANSDINLAGRYANQIETQKRTVNAAEAYLKKCQDDLASGNYDIITMTDTQLKALGLQRTDNKGKLHDLNDQLNKWRQVADDKIAENKRHRNAKAEALFVDGDVSEYGVDERSKTPYQSTMRGVGQDRKAPKAYALDTPYGKKANRALQSAYYASKYWTGRITMPYLDEDSAKEYLKNDTHLPQRLRAIKSFHRIGKAILALKTKGDQTSIDAFLNSLVGMFAGDVKTIKVGKETVTASDVQDMVKGLPLITVLFQPRYGKQQIILNNTDLLSKNAQKDDYDLIDERIETIGNILLSYREKKNKKSESDVINAEEGLSEEMVDDTFTNGVSIPKGGVHVYYNGFEYNLVTEADTADDIFQVDGESLSPEQLRQHFETAASDAYEKAIQNEEYIRNFLKTLNFDDSQINNLFEPAKHGDKRCNLEVLLEGILKYGDGQIDAYKTFIPRYVKETLGAISAQLPGKTAPDRAVFIAKQLMDMLADIAPEQFLSYGVNTQVAENTPPVDIAMEDAFQKNLLQRKDSGIIVYKDGEEIDAKDKSDENRKTWTDVFQFFEDTLNGTNTADDFFRTLGANGYDFKFKDDKTAAYQILRDYYNNRKFGRLVTPSNIYNAITLAKATPLNGNIDYNMLHRRTRHQNSKITEVKPLGLIKDENGKYLYSIETFEQRNQPTETTSENDNEFKVQKEAVESRYKGMINTINSIKKKGQLVELIQQWSKDNLLGKPVLDIENTDDAELLQSLLNAKGDALRNGATLASAKNGLILRLDAKRDAEIDQLKKTIKTKEVNEDVADEDFMKGHHTAPLVFAYGSFRNSEGHSSIVYFDADGGKHERQNDSGLPGSVYLMIPPYMNSQRITIPAHLNVRKFNDTEAGIIARLLVYAKDHLNEYLPGGEFKTELGTIKSDGTVKEILDSLIYTGADSVINNPTEENYARLLILDKGYLHFGADETEGTEQNVDELAQFIMNEKTYRIDMSKATDYNATYGFNMQMTDAEGNEILNRKANQNYIAGTIDDGIVLTDLNHSKIFGNATVRSEYNKKWTLNGTTGKVSATSAKESKKQKFEAASPEELQEHLVNGGKATSKEGVDPSTVVQVNVNNITGIAKTYLKSIGNYLLSKLPTKINGEKLNDVQLAYINIDGHLSKTRWNFSRDESGENGAEFVCTEENAPVVFANYMINLIKNDAGNAFAILDKDGNKIIVDGKALQYGKGFKHYVYTAANGTKYGFTVGTQAGTATQQASTSTQQGASNDVVGQLLTQLAETTKQNQQILQLLAGQQGIPVAQGQPQANTSQPAEKGPVANFEIPSDGKAAPKTAVEKTENAAQKALSIFAARNIDIEDYSSYEQFEEEEVSPGRFNDEELEAIKQYFAGMAGGEHPSSQQIIPQGVGGVPGKVRPNTAASGIVNELAESFAANSASKSTKGKTETKNAKAGTKQPTAGTANPAAFSSDWMENALNDLTVDNVGAWVTKTKYHARGNNFDARLRNMLYDYLTSKGYNPLQSSGIVSELISRNGGRVFTDLTNSVNTGSILEFIDERVPKEDFQSAYEYAQRILGKDFDLTITGETPNVWDNSRQAQVYVFGQCAASGIRLFRDASGNIAKGSLYHEAFHRVSLFILSAEDRAKMYDTARKQNKDLRDVSDRFVEEYLADRFAEFVEANKQSQHGKYYSSNNVLAKLFQKLVDSIRSIINRLTKANITPRYTDMNSLFKNMYSGRYAYAKATKNNIELFESTYFDNIPYKGFEVNGKTLANDSVQYENIRRHLLATFVDLSGAVSSTTGILNVSTDDVRNDLRKDLENYGITYNKLFDPAFSKTAEYKSLIKAHGEQWVFDQAFKLSRIVNLYNNILKDENWAEWEKILKKSIDREFGLDRQKQEADANNNSEGIINLTEDPDENVVAVEEKNNVDYSANRDGFIRDMYSAMGINTKMLLYDVCTSEAEFNNDGLLIYNDPRVLYTNITQAADGARTLKEFEEKLGKAAEKAVQSGDMSLRTFYTKFAEEASPNMKNRIFVDLCKYKQNFQNASYETEEGEDGTVSFSAAVKNATADTIESQLKLNMQTSISSFMSMNTGSFSNSSKLLNWKNAVANIVKTFKKKNLTDTEYKDIANGLLINFGISLTNELPKDVEVLKKLHSSSTDALSAFDKFARGLLASDFVQQTSRTRAGKYEVVDKIAKAFTGTLRDAGLAKFAMEVNRFMPTTAKAMSQRGPGGTKIYARGQYNYITKMANIFMKAKDWVARQKNNPYAKHSLWLQDLSQQGSDASVKFMTNLATVLDDDTLNSRADKEISGIEYTMNLFTYIMEGMHNIPSLANKKFAGCFTGLTSFTNVIDDAGYFNPQVIKAFKGYLADELLAICDAIHTKKRFLRQLNDLLKTDYTEKTFSALSSLEQEKLFNNNPAAAQLLKDLVLVYHYKDGKPQWVFDGDRIMLRAFHIDLTKSYGTQFRHFKQLGAKIAAEHNLEQLSDTVTDDMYTNPDRKQDIAEIERIVDEYTDDIEQDLRKSIEFVKADLIDKGLISTDVHSPVGIANRFLPENKIKDRLGIKTVNSEDLYKAIALFAVQNMSDMIEFEKLISGDIGLHKNITSVNKRYSGLASTTDLVPERGSIMSQWNTDDRLYESPTFNSLTLQTSKVVNKDAYINNLTRVLGVDPIDYTKGHNGFEVNDENELVAILDTSKLLKDGKLKQEVANSIEAIRFKETMPNATDIELAEAMVNDANTKFSTYLQINPTDAQVYVTPQMFRQMLQRHGEWTDVTEAQYNLLENYDVLPRMYKSSNMKPLIQDALKLLNVNIKDFEARLAAYQKSVKQNDKNGIENYKGYILGITEGFDTTSLKWVYFGEDAGRTDYLQNRIYDKMSLKVMMKIFTDGHELDKLRMLAEKRNIDYIKFESATKQGGMPSFEAYDEHGKFNTKSLSVAPIQQQYFEFLGAQLNTDPHKELDTTLLTQFMKITMTDIKKDATYTVNGHGFTGEQLLHAYKRVLDELTVRGAKKFRRDFGIADDGSTVDKKKFMAKLQDMMKTQGLPAESVAALNVDDTGNWLTHPSALPQIRSIQSRIISEMGKTIISTAIPGVPLYQVASFGYDNIFGLKTHSDKKLLMPGEKDSKGNYVSRMQVRVSINMFGDLITQAKRAQSAGDKALADYDFNNFADQKRFLMQNKDMIALSYRVPTQGQDSTIPVEVVDILPSQEGGIVEFPAALTALTGSDFDIDKMYTARYNYKIVNGKIKKVNYNFDNIDNDRVTLQQSDQQLQNMLLDMYQTVLTSREHYVAANAPLDVCTGPVKDTIRRNIVSEKSDQEGQDLFYTTPTFQCAQKVKNSGSDAGIAPMALNSVFRYWVQSSGLVMNITNKLKELGLGSLNRKYDRHGNLISDQTNAQINAFVDAVKDNYIGAGNVNEYTFDVTSLLTSLGFGNDLYCFLMQPVIVKAAQNYSIYKLGKVGVNPTDAKGQAFLAAAAAQSGFLLEEIPAADSVSGDWLTTEKMEQEIKHPTEEGQIAYLSMFLQIKELAGYYRQALTVAQVDTKKYGISADELIAFQQKVDAYKSDYDFAFQNPEVLFDNTWLGVKYELGVKGLFNALNSVIFEFSDKFKDICDELCTSRSLYGKNNKDFLKRVSPKIKTVFMNNFFNNYLFQRFGTNAPLLKLTSGEDSVPGRFAKIRKKCLKLGVGIEFFNNVKCSFQNVRLPQFMLVSNAVKDNPLVKNNVQSAISEMIESGDPEIKQWVQDMMVYMYYLSGGTDANGGGRIKTTLYDILPPQHFGNLSVKTTSGDMTFNDYVEQYMMNPTAMPNNMMEQIHRLAAITDDDFYPTLRKSKNNMIFKLDSKGTVITIGKTTKPITFGGFRSGCYIPYIKVRDFSGTTTYKLIGAVTVKGKNDAIYMNPIYAKVQNLGYVVNTQRAFSVRADGYVDENGDIKSMIWRTPEGLVKDFDQLIEMFNSKKLSKPIKAIEFYRTDENGMVDYSDSKSEYDDDHLRMLVDNADELIYMNGDYCNTKILDYAKMRDKKVTKLLDENTKLDAGKTYLVAVANPQNTAYDVLNVKNQDSKISKFYTGELRQLQSKTQPEKETGKPKTKDTQPANAVEQGKKIKEHCKS